MLLDENEIQELKGIARDGLYQGPKTVTDLCDTIEAQKQAMEDVRVLVSCGNCTDAELLINRVMRTDPIDYHNPSDIAEIEQLKSTLNGCDKCMFFNNVREDAMNSLDLRSEISRLKADNQLYYDVDIERTRKVQEQAGKIMRMEAALKNAREVLDHCSYVIDQIAPGIVPRPTEGMMMAENAIRVIDEILGGVGDDIR